eukprot:scaffold1196_cov151-Pinguiococcus_pyrenoidosus.AAC.8
MACSVRSRLVAVCSSRGRLASAPSAPASAAGLRPHPHIAHHYYGDTDWTVSNYPIQYSESQRATWTKGDVGNQSALMRSITINFPLRVLTSSRSAALHLRVHRGKGIQHTLSGHILPRLDSPTILPLVNSDTVASLVFVSIRILHAFAL